MLNDNPIAIQMIMHTARQMRLATGSLGDHRGPLLVLLVCLCIFFDCASADDDRSAIPLLLPDSTTSFDLHVRIGAVLVERRETLEECLSFVKEIAEMLDGFGGGRRRNERWRERTRELRGRRERKPKGQRMNREHKRPKTHSCLARPPHSWDQPFRRPSPLQHRCLHSADLPQPLHYSLSSSSFRALHLPHQASLPAPRTPLQQL